MPSDPPATPRPRPGSAHELFDPEGVTFIPVSPRLATVRVVGSVLLAIPFLVAGVVAAALTHPVVWAAPALVLALLAWDLWLIPRQVRAMGYAETEDDLLWRKGVMFRRLTVVPYGRMQYVDVSEGPVARRFGIAEVKLHTASATTDAVIHGLPAEEAARLRRRLTELGEARMAGL